VTVQPMGIPNTPSDWVVLVAFAPGMFRREYFSAPFQIQARGTLERRDPPHSHRTARRGDRKRRRGASNGR